MTNLSLRIFGLVFLDLMDFWISRIFGFHNFHWELRTVCVQCTLTSHEIYNIRVIPLRHKNYVEVCLPGKFDLLGKFKLSEKCDFWET